MRQFVESLKRLFESELIDKQKVIELFNGNKITENEKQYILNEQ